MIKEERRLVKKVWGEELWIVNRLNYCGKILVVNRNAVSSYHQHQEKMETFWCIEGHAILTIEGVDYDLTPMARAKTIMPGERHKFRGVTKRAFILEVSTYHDDADVIRHEVSHADSL